MGVNSIVAKVLLIVTFFMCAEVCTGDHLDSSFSVVAGINYFVFWLKKWVWIYE